MSVGRYCTTLSAKSTIVKGTPIILFALQWKAGYFSSHLYLTQGGFPMPEGYCLALDKGKSTVHLSTQFNHFQQNKPFFIGLSVCLSLHSTLRATKKYNPIKTLGSLSCIELGISSTLGAEWCDHWICVLVQTFLK